MSEDGFDLVCDGDHKTEVVRDMSLDDGAA